MAKTMITEDMWARIFRKSPAVMPDNPTAMGWSAREIKEAFYRFILDEKDSVRAIIEVLLGLVTSQGTVTISPTQWTNVTPYRADVFMPGDVFGKGCVVLFAPEDDDTKEAAGKAMLSMTIGGTLDQNTPIADYVVIARAEGGEAPTIPLNFRYVILKTGTEDEVLVAMIGVDAVGAGGTGGETGGGSGVDEAAVRAIINQVVPAWARASTKPTYNKDDVGLGNVDNVKQYSGSNPPDYPVDSVNGKTGAVQLNADDVGARSSSWMPTAAQVGADPSGTAATKVSDHDTYTGSHNDIRLLIKALQEQVNKFLDVDDTTRDELSEVLALIDANAGTLESLTSSKVNVADIINNLTTNVTNKPLSAAQGVALKKLIDALSTGKLDASALDSAIEGALAEAKSSGDFKGDPGTSVTIKSISESAESGGESVVTFSDGKTLKVKNGKDGSGGESVTLPDYWESYLPSKISAIKALQEAGGKDAFSFVVMSDIHYPTNLGKRSPAVAKRVMEACDIRYALVLGDLQNSGVHSTYDATREEWDAIHTMFAPLMKNALFQRGNHDGSWGAALSDGTTYPYNFRPEELYALIHAKTYANHNAVTDESGTGYYVDDASRKVRYVMLNTHCNEYAENADGSAVYNNMSHARYTQSQYDLLVEALKTLKDGWSVLVASHVPPNGAYNDAFGGDGTTGDNVIMQGLLRAFKNKTTYTASWSGTAGGGGGYTNLFDPSADGYSVSGTTYYTNWLSYEPLANNGAGTKYHIKGLMSDVTGDWTRCPYKYHFRYEYTDGWGESWNGYEGCTPLSYCHTAAHPSEESDYDASVRTFQPQFNPYADGYPSGKKVYIQFEIRQSTIDGLTITANEEIIGDGNSESGYDAVSVDVDFSDAKGELIGYFSGHMHKDYVYKASDFFGFNIVTTACDTDLNTSVTKTAGTVTEQSFDVFTVNRKTRTVYATKIGAGEDRVISY